MNKYLFLCIFKYSNFYGWQFWMSKCQISLTKHVPKALPINTLLHGLRRVLKFIYVGGGQICEGNLIKISKMMSTLFAPRDESSKLGAGSSFGVWVLTLGILLYECNANRKIHVFMNMFDYKCLVFRSVLRENNHFCVVCE